MHQFYRPGMSAEEVAQLDWSNWVHLNAASALLGLVSPNVRRVHVEATTSDLVTAYFLFRRDRAADRENIEEFVFDLDGALNGHTQIEVVVDIGRDWAEGHQVDWADTRRRPLYRAHDRTPVPERVAYWIRGKVRWRAPR